MAFVGLMFQSTPGFKAGRYGILAQEHGQLGQFQSTPGFKAGRYVAVSQRYRVPIVSIHSRL